MKPWELDWNKEENQEQEQQLISSGKPWEIGFIGEERTDQPQTNGDDTPQVSAIPEEPVAAQPPAQAIQTETPDPTGVSIYTGRPRSPEHQAALDRQQAKSNYSAPIESPIGVDPNSVIDTGKTIANGEMIAKHAALFGLSIPNSIFQYMEGKGVQFQHTYDSQKNIGLRIQNDDGTVTHYRNPVEAARAGDIEAADALIQLNHDYTTRKYFGLRIQNDDGTVTHYRNPDEAAKAGDIEAEDALIELNQDAEETRNYMENAGLAMESFAGPLADKLTGMIDDIRDRENENFIEGYFSDLSILLGEMAGYYFAGVIGGPQIGLMALADQVATKEYLRLIEEGHDQSDAARRATLQAAYEVIGEKVFGVMERFIGPTNAGRFTQALAEGGSESLTESLSIIDEFARDENDQSVEEILGRLAYASGLGVGMGYIIGTGRVNKGDKEKKPGGVPLDDLIKSGAIDMRTGENIDSPPDAPTQPPTPPTQPPTPQVDIPTPDIGQRSAIPAPVSEPIQQPQQVNLEPPTPEAMQVQPVEGGGAIEQQSRKFDMGGAPASTGLVKPHELKIDPETYQYKTQTNDEGVDGSLEIEQWSPAAAGTMIVHRRSDGDFVADGHQRSGAARRLIENGADPDGIFANAIILDEADGWTPQMVRATAAIVNIQQGNGTVVDAARIMKEGGPEVAAELEATVSKKKTFYKDAKAIARLEGDAFDIVATGQVPEHVGVAVGRHIRGEGKQLAAMQYFMKNEPATKQHAETVARDIARMDASSSAPDQGDMLGGMMDDVPFKERAKIINSAKRKAKGQRALFNTLVENAARIQGQNPENVLDKEGNSRLAQDAATITNLIDRMLDTNPEINQRLNDLAGKLKRGEINEQQASEELINAVKTVADSLKAGGTGQRGEERDAGTEDSEGGAGSELLEEDGQSPEQGTDEALTLTGQSQPKEPPKQPETPSTDLFGKAPSESQQALHKKRLESEENLRGEDVDVTEGDGKLFVPEEFDTDRTQQELSASENKVFTEDAAEEARKILSSKLGQINTGVDPEVLRAGITLAGYHIEKGARTFAAYSKAVVSDLGDMVKPYLKSWYMGVMFDPAAADFDGMDSPDSVSNASIEDILSKEEATEEEAEQLPAEEDAPFMKFQKMIHDRVSDGEKITAAHAKSMWEEAYGEKVLPGTEVQKRMQETLEAIMVDYAAGALDGMKKDGTLSKELMLQELAEIQSLFPNFSARSSTSVSNQAYSTPLPLAYVASNLAGISNSTTVYEPSAGNGALLIEAAPEKVEANEINPDRAENLRVAVGGEAKITTEDGSIAKDGPKVDVVIANPPFGTVKGKDGNNRTWEPRPGYKTQQIDHAMVFAALERMKDDGKAVLIIGAAPGKNDLVREKGYMGKAKREFYYHLNQLYRVVDHFTVDGDLYRSQGAAFPVDVIVIHGRGPSGRDLPAGNLPAKVNTLDQLKERLKNEIPTPKDVGSLDDTSKPTKPGRSGSDSGLPAREDAREEDRQDGNVSGQPEAQDGEPAIGNAEEADAGQLELGGESTVRGGNRPVGTGDGSDGVRAEPVRPDANSVPDREEGGRQNERSAAADGAQSGESSGDSGRGQLSEAIDVSGVNRTPTKQTGGKTQTPYQPLAGNYSLGVLVPKNMSDSVTIALQAFKDKKGDPIEYVAQKLKTTREELESKGYFAAEQIDAIALAISNVEAGSGFVLGDQTGIGKGRVVAAMLEYARLNGLVPIFVTEKPNLYKDMYRDLVNIGVKSPESKILMTNGGVSLELDEQTGVTIKTPATKAHNKALVQMTKNQSIGGFDYVFTTYSQMQPARGTELPRTNFIRAMAVSNGMLVLDESHNAAGSGGDPTGRALLVRSLVAEARGVVYSSATWAKRPNVMDLYNSTNMRFATTGSRESMINAIEVGGVPLQQWISSALVEEGQMLRRERSFEGIKYETKLVEVEREAAEKISQVMGLINEINNDVKRFTKTLQKELNKEGKVAGEGKIGVESTTFGSTMHNLINQMLLSMKAPAAAREAIAMIEKGIKPVLTVSNTNESFLQQFAEENGLFVGSKVDISFSDLLERYRRRSMVYKIKDPMGEAQELSVSRGELNHSARMAYDSVTDLLEELKGTDLPISPIDYIENEIRKAGYSIGEITGRDMILQYNTDGTMELARRDAFDRTPAGKNKTLDGFNKETVDALLLNQSGSTGLSAHASKDFMEDPKPRSMIIVQAEANVDTHMQMLGRINRTGQVKLPHYVQFAADIPAEMRPAAVLAKKMASLNANVSAARGSDVTSNEVVDFMNVIGEGVLKEMIAEDPGYFSRLGVTSKEGDGLLAKVTGRIPMLTIAEQQDFYTRLVENYNAALSYYESIGESPLESKDVDLAASVVGQPKEIFKGNNPNSKFGGSAYLVNVSAKVQGKPMSGDEVFDAVDRIGDQSEMIEAKINAHDEYRKSREASTKDLKKKADAISSLNESKHSFISMARSYKPGIPVIISIDGGITTKGVLLGLTTSSAKNDKGDPLAASKWHVNVAVADGMRKVRVPFSQIKSGKYKITQTRESREKIKEAFDAAKTTSRESRVLITGNLLAGMSTFAKGQISSFTWDDGSTEIGVLLPKNFDSKEELEKMPVSFETADQALAWMDENNAILESETDGVAVYTDGDSYEIRVPGSKKDGGKYFLDNGLLSITGDFYKKSGKFSVEVSYSQARRAIEYMKSNLDVKWHAKTHKEQARKIVGEASEADPETRFMAGNLYSGAERHLAANLPGKATGKKLASLVEKWIGEGRIKREEIKWMGLIPYLEAAGDNEINSSDVMAFVRENRFQATEINLDSTPEQAISAISEMLLSVDVNKLDAQQQKERQRMLTAMTNHLTGETTLSGVLLDNLWLNATKQAYADAVPNKELYENVLKTRPYIYNIGNYVTEDVTDYKEKLIKWGSTNARHYNAHYGDQNVLMHVRYGTRITNDGKRMLHIDELQSDWLQDARKLGTASKIEPVMKDVLGKAGYTAQKIQSVWIAVDKDGNYLKRSDGITAVTADLSELAAIATKDPSYMEYGRAVVPDAPFQKTSAWVLHAMKRMITEAVAEGYDGISFAPTAIIRDRVTKPHEKNGISVFYDKTVPSTLNKYLKQWGAKVEVRKERVTNNGGVFTYDMARIDFNDQMMEDSSEATLFSLSGESETGVDVRQAEGFIKRLMRRWKQAPKVVVVQSTADLPAAVKDEMRRTGHNNPKAVYHQTGSTGVVYVVADNVSGKEDIERAIYHEIKGHYGLRILAAHTGENLDQIFDEVWDSIGREPMEGIIQQYFRNEAFDEGNAEHRRKVVDEWLSSKQETPMPASLTQRLLAAVRRMLRKLGFTSLAKYSNAEIQILLSNASDIVEHGTVAGASFAKRVSLRKADTPSQRFAGSLFGNFTGFKPLDRVAAAPYSLFGGLDAARRWIPGLRAEQKVTSAITSGKLPKWLPEWLHSFVEIARAGLVDRYQQTEELKRVSRAAAAEKNRIMLVLKDILEKLEVEGKSNLAEARVLQDILEGKTTAPEEWKNISDPIRRALDDLGMEMVKLGLLKPETYQKGLGTWVHQSFYKHEAQLTGLKKAYNNRQKRKRAQLQGDALRARGIKVEVTLADLVKHANWWGLRGEKVKGQPNIEGRNWLILDEVIPAGQGTGTLEGVEEAENKPRVSNRIYWPADVPIPDRFAHYENRGEFEVLSNKGSKIVLRREFSDTELENMGKIMDARYNLIKSFNLLAHDISQGRYFKTIANNPEWVQDKPMDGEIVLSASEANRWDLFTGVDWVRVPSTKTGEGGPNKWGELAGKLVRPEIWRDLNELDKQMNPGTWASLMSHWKLNKTARSLTVHTNNVMSNMAFMHLADVSASELVEGIYEFVKKGELYREAAQHSAFSANMIEQEIARNHLRPILDQIKKDMLAESETERSGRVLGTMLGAIYDKIKSADRSLVELYSAEDSVFRMATYIHYRKLGYSAEEAAQIAIDQFLNYDIRAPWINMLRRSGLPFISYTYRAVPAAAKAVAHRPWKLTNMIAFGAAANWLAYLMSDDDEEEEREVMRDELQVMTWASVPGTEVGLHRMVKIPYDFGTDMPHYLDFMRWMPAGDIYNFSQGQFEYLPAPLQVGGPLLFAFENMINKSAFTGEEIVDKDVQSWDQRLLSRLDYAWKFYAPSSAYIPGSWHNEKLLKAAMGAEDDLGRKYSVATAVLSGVGVKVRPFDIQEERGWRAYDIKVKMNGIRKAMMSLERRKGDMTQSYYEYQMRRYKDSLERLKSRAEKLND